MDNESSFTREKGNGQKSQGSRSSSSPQPEGFSESGISRPDLLARLPAATGHSTELDQAFVQLMNQNSCLPSSPSTTSYNSSLHHGAATHPEILPTSPSGFAWNQPACQQGWIHQHQALMIPSMVFGGLSHNTLMPLFVPASPDNGGGWRISTGLSLQSAQLPTPSKIATSASLSTSSPSGTEVDPTDGEQAALAEEKRRRNTAASVRFRIKKKQRTISLERSVSELTGRAEELEKEVVDLRRENRWLKEIVMLKSTRHAAQQAMSQVIRASGIDLNSGGRDQTSTSSSGPTFSRTTTAPEEMSSEDESQIGRSKVDKKGKGKKSVLKGAKK